LDCGCPLPLSREATVKKLRTRVLELRRTINIITSRHYNPTHPSNLFQPALACILSAVRTFFKLVTTLLLAAVFLFVVYAYWLWRNQERMIFLPHSRADLTEILQQSHGLIESLSYEHEGKKQTAFFIPSRDGMQSGRIWIGFHGNGSIALDWLNLLPRQLPTDDGFLLVDYPGYGLCEGKPTVALLLPQAELAVEALAKKIAVDRKALDQRLDVMGYSLGTGVAMEFAARHPVRRVILFAPYTSLADMAKRTVGPVLAKALRADLDNRARLQEIASRPAQDRPRIIIFHGEKDDDIPFSMGEALAREFPEFCQWRPYANANHIDIGQAAAEEFQRSLRNPPAPWE